MNESDHEITVTDLADRREQTSLMTFGRVQNSAPPRSAGTDRAGSRHASGPDGQRALMGRMPPSRGLPLLVAPAVGALVAGLLHREVVRRELLDAAAARRSEELTTALLRAVSHDLRTPLTAIITAGHALGSQSLTGNERDQLTTAVVEQGERLAALIDKLFDISRLQAGRLEPCREPVSLEEVVQASMRTLPAAADRVRLAVEPDTPCLIADAAQLERVFANLIENALRYSDASPVHVSVRPIRTRLVVRVTDHGPGIPASEQERVFEPFYRGCQERPGTGSGLGLAIAKGLVEANGGTIAVQSLPGQGTHLVVTFARGSQGEY